MKESAANHCGCIYEPFGVSCVQLSRQGISAGLFHPENWDKEGSKSVEGLTLKDLCILNSYWLQWAAECGKLARQSWGFAAGTIKGHPTVHPKKASKAKFRSGHRLGQWLWGLQRFMWSPQSTGSHSITVVPWVCFLQRFAQNVGKCLPNLSAHSAKPHSSPSQDSRGAVITNVVLAPPWTNQELAKSWVKKDIFLVLLKSAILPKKNPNKPPILRLMCDINQK